MLGTSLEHVQTVTVFPLLLFSLFRLRFFMIFFIYLF